MTKAKSCLYLGLLLGFLVVGSGATIADVRAEESHADQAVPESIKHVLDQQQGKRVKLRLSSGQDVEGTVTSVSAQTVKITQLSGMEFYDAVVRIEHVSAVIVRGKSK